MTMLIILKFQQTARINQAGKNQTRKRGLNSINKKCEVWSIFSALSGRKINFVESINLLNKKIILFVRDN